MLDECLRTIASASWQKRVCSSVIYLCYDSSLVRVVYVLPMVTKGTGTELISHINGGAVPMVAPPLKALSLHKPVVCCIVDGHAANEVVKEHLCILLSLSALL
jgi:hypothetical protein